MIDSIFTHRSIRKYTSDPIPDKILEEVLEAGIRASNTGNMQIYSIIVTKDQELRNKLWESHFKQDMVKQAPVTITFCADINRFNKWCNLRNAKPGYDNFLWFLNGSIDALLASQNICIQAEEHGLGICYLGTTTYMARSIINILDLPKGVIPVTTIALGYPDEKPGLTDRLPQRAVVHMDRYQDYSEEEINQLYQEKEALKETLQLIEENKTENLAQIFTDKRYTKKDNVLFSKEYLKLLDEQGFMNHDD